MKLFLLTLSGTGALIAIYCIITKLSAISNFEDWLMLLMLITLLAMSAIGVVLNYMLLQKRSHIHFYNPKIAS